MVRFHFATVRMLAACIIFAAFSGVISSPLAVTPSMKSSRSSLGQLEQRDDRRYTRLPIKLMRRSKTGSIISSPNTKVSVEEDWAIFIGTDGFQARPGPSGTLMAVRVEEPRVTGGRLAKIQDLGETATFSSPEQKARVFQGLLTDVPALHQGNGIGNTNLAYLNGIFAYLASSSVKAVSTEQPPEAWMTMYNKMIEAQSKA